MCTENDFFTWKGTTNHLFLSFHLLTTTKASLIRIPPQELGFNNMAESSNTIFEEREALMVSLVGDGKPILRKAHFLKPTTSSIVEPELPLDYQAPLTPTFRLKSWPVKVKFTTWRHRQNDWNNWVSHMQSMHQSAWKKAGIDEAILISTYDMKKNHDLIFGLAKKWCPKTNTFVFPWGEVTITLEDVMVLGGYPVLGSPVSCSVQNGEWKEIEEKLLDARKEIGKSKSNKAAQSVWMKKFINSGSEIEHEAFLCLWLSRFLFQNSSQIIRKEVFPLAIHLAKGIPVALAPAVLASIYRDLSQLKMEMVNLTKSSACEFENNVSKLEFFSPLQFVQLWAWERIPALRPKPNMLSFGDPRSARWNKVDVPKSENVRLALDMAGHSFLWRPYAKKLQNWSFPKFYKEKQVLVLADSELDSHVESFVRCLRVSKLAGLDYMENYYPHRVAMQFGIDQDLPGCVALEESPGIAWMNNCKPINDPKFHIPSRLFEANVTTRYLKWWKELVKGQQQRDTTNGSVQQQRNLKTSKPDSWVLEEKQKAMDPDVPPGFLPKTKMVVSGNLVERGKPEEVETITCNNQQNFGDGLICNGEVPDHSQDNLASLTPDGAVRKMELLPKSAQKGSDSEDTVGTLGAAMEMEVGKESRARINGTVAQEADGHTLEMPILDLESRISVLEREVAKLKATRFGNRFEWTY